MKNSRVVGYLLIGLIMLGYLYYVQPSQEEIDKIHTTNDSIRIAQTAIAEEQKNQTTQKATIKPSPQQLREEQAEEYGRFSNAVMQSGSLHTLENNLIKITLNSQGAQPARVELKNYTRWNGEPLVLFEENESKFGFRFFSNTKIIETNELYFTPNTNTTHIVVQGEEVKKNDWGIENDETKKNTQSISFKLYTNDSSKYIEYRYTLAYNSYKIKLDVRFVGLDDIIFQNNNNLGVLWESMLLRQERKIDYLGEDNNSTIYYRFFKDAVEELDHSGDDETSVSTKLEWIAYKQLFFSSILVADKSFSSAKLESYASDYTEDDKYLRKLRSEMVMNELVNNTIGLTFHYTPNKYAILEQHDMLLEDVIYLGYSFLSWVNTLIIIPLFNVLSGLTLNMGLVIILLTLIIKTFLFPLTFRSYKSMARMRVLKPEVDEINKRFPKEKAMERQQALMGLYRQAGVNPLGGCLPMLLQMPILFAMFFFFPGAFELRQESFWGTVDLSSYDSFISFGTDIPLLGNHISLYCLLMTISSLVYTWMNNQSNTGQQMPGMKTMMYLMPIAFFFLLNNYPSGLTFYYFLANLITISQMLIAKSVINEKAIHAKIQANKKKKKPKSAFQRRLEEMAKQRNKK